MKISEAKYEQKRRMGELQKIERDYCKTLLEGYKISAISKGDGSEVPVLANVDSLLNALESSYLNALESSYASCLTCLTVIVEYLIRYGNVNTPFVIYKVSKNGVRIKEIASP